MFEERLPTSVWVDALLRRAQVGGASGFVLQKGDGSRGDVIVKITDLRGLARVYAPRTNMDGARIFVDLSVQNVGPDEHDVDNYIRKAMARDSDLWAIEIEDRDMRHFITEPVEGAASKPDTAGHDGDAGADISPQALFPKLR